MYYVYALYSLEYDKIYVGVTSDLKKRLDSHNHPKNRKWTGKYMPWRVIYYEKLVSKILALKRERQLKSYRGRLFIRSLLQS